MCPLESDERRVAKSGYRYHMPRYLRGVDEGHYATPSTLWHGFVEDTSVHGLPNLDKARGIV